MKSSSLSNAMGGLTFARWSQRSGLYFAIGQLQCFVTVSNLEQSLMKTWDPPPRLYTRNHFCASDTWAMSDGVCAGRVAGSTLTSVASIHNCGKDHAPNETANRMISSSLRRLQLRISICSCVSYSRVQARKKTWGCSYWCADAREEEWEGSEGAHERQSSHRIGG